MWGIEKYLIRVHILFIWFKFTSNQNFGLYEKFCLLILLQWPAYTRPACILAFIYNWTIINMGDVFGKVDVCSLWTKLMTPPFMFLYRCYLRMIVYVGRKLFVKYLMILMIEEKERQDPIGHSTSTSCLCTIVDYVRCNKKMDFFLVQMIFYNKTHPISILIHFFPMPI